MRTLIKNTKGYTLIELIATISVLGIVSLAVGSILIYLLSSFDLSSNKNSVGLVAQRALTKMTDEIRGAMAEPNNFRIWVSNDRKSLRFYLSENLADSIKYTILPVGTGSFLFRSFGGQPEVLVPDFSQQMVDYLGAIFSVDDNAIGFSQKGKVNINLTVGKNSGTKSEEINIFTEVSSRNY
jgi:prepilin-type N-terminal cleavage/methylation domain-containing protein